MQQTVTPTSTKPYLVRAIHEWCSDNGFTPYLAVSVTDAVQVPKEHVRNGEIVLNVSMLATDKLQIQNEEITFQARFSGRVQQIIVPMDNLRAIYAKETGNGMAFELQQESPPQPMESAALPAQQSDLPQPPKSPKGPDGRPKLTRVK